MIYDVIRTIPPGKVTSFQEIALVVNTGRMSSVDVRMAIKHNPNPDVVNSHRVVCADGGLSDSYPLGGKQGQK
jgi:O6-methylguanine-DNA--protein-cysteine methyltransferase